MKGAIVRRAVLIVGVSNRDHYVSLLDKASDGEMYRNANFHSQMLMTFRIYFNNVGSAFVSNAARDRGNLLSSVQLCCFLKFVKHALIYKAMLSKELLTF